MSIIERAAEAVRKVFEEKSEAFGDWLTPRHPETGVWSHEGEVPDEAIVRAVLQAIREPDKQWSWAGVAALGDSVGDVVSEDGARAVWQGMIDAALDEHNAKRPAG